MRILFIVYERELLFPFILWNGNGWDDLLEIF